MRKKILATAVVMTMAAALAGCGASNGGSVNDNNDTTQEEMTSEETSENISDNSEQTEENLTSEETSESDNDDTSESINTDVSQSEDSTSVSNYGIATTASDADVEKFASDVKDAVLSSDWNALGDMISYPIKIGDNEIADKAAFVSLMQSSDVQAEFIKAMEDEDCTGLMANGQGICMGSGEVWFLDMNYDGIEQKGNPDFKIITFNGII